MDLLRKSLPFTDVKAGGDGSTFEGYCAVFHNCDSYGDVILPGAFDATLEDFKANGQILFNHYELIGKPLDASVDPRGLFVKAQVSDTSRGRDCKTLLKDGVLRKMSIGYRAVGRKPTNADDIKAYWKAAGYTPSAEDLFNVEDCRGYLSFLTAIKLYEASPVGFPANTQADITGVKSVPRLSEIKALTRELAEARKSGRSISKANRERLKAVHDALHPAVKDLAALLDETDPDAAGDETPGATEPAASDDSDSDPKAARAASLKAARAALQLLACDPMLG